MKTNILFKQGYLYIAKFNPASGGIRKTRPCLVIQSDFLNNEINSVMVVPISSSNKNDRPGYQIKIQSIYLENESYLLTNLITTLDKSRFSKELGSVSKDVYKQVIKTIFLLIE